MDTHRHPATDRPLSRADNGGPARSFRRIRAVPGSDQRPPTGTTGRPIHIGSNDLDTTAVTVVAPLLGMHDDLTPAVERCFFHLAAAAQAGDDAARDILYTAVLAKLDRFVIRTSRLAWDTGTTRRNGVPWVIEDLQQERFPIFVDLLQCWDGRRPFGGYLLAHFPWRLRHILRALSLAARSEVTPLPPNVALLSDGSFAADETRLLIEELAIDRRPIEQALLLWHLRDGESLGVVARRLNRNRRTITRHWHTLQGELRRDYHKHEQRE